MSHENRYRAERKIDGKIELSQLREQLGPPAQFIEDCGETNKEAAPAKVAAAENPAGPRAKTADLKLKPGAPQNSSSAKTNGPATAYRPPAADTESPSPKVATEPEAESNAAKDHTDTASSASTDTGRPEREEKSESDSVGSLEIREAVVLAEPAVEAETASTAKPAEFTEAAAANGHGSSELGDADISAPSEHDDLGDVFGRVRALSLTLNHPAFQRATEGFYNNGRVYLVYSDEELTPLSRRRGGLRMDEGEALNVATQLCQAVSFAHRRGLRVNDICPESVAYGKDGRVKLTGLDYISNDNELQAEPIFNDGYSAPEIYRAKKVDKRADVFSVGALLYALLTGERLDSEAWREEAGPIRFYPPHVVSPALEQVVRRALLFDPAARWPSVDLLKAELVKLAGVIRISAGAITDVGMMRDHNEDSIMVAEYLRDSLIERSQNYLYVVADGMGGAEAGEVASAIAVGAIRNYVESKLATAGAVDVRMLLQDALEAANDKIIEYQAAHAEARSMGSTAVGALIVPPEAAVAWVGDSRAYLCENEGLRQITKDHSLVQRLLEIGQISPEEARHHEHKNVITRSLGARQKGPAGAESIALRLKRGDRLMLCSDGLTTHVEDKQIGEILLRYSDPYDAARELVVAANAGGGTDNVSVVVIYAG